LVVLARRSATLRSEGDMEMEIVRVVLIFVLDNTKYYSS
jgi:hypothetical protein